MALALVLVASFSIPVFASTGIGTSVTVMPGGDPPVVKCKWEQDITPSLEDGDPGHLTAGSQFLPPMAKCATKLICYFAVVTDNQDAGDVAQVFADVYHPTNSPPPYSTSSDPRGPFFKYEIPFAKLGHGTADRAIVNAAYNAGLITFGPGRTIGDVIFEMEKGVADLWYGCAPIDYEQPAGDYTVNVFAIDKTSTWSAALTNYFQYLAVAGVEVDFTSIAYGPVSLNQETMRPGDTIWSSPAPAGFGQVNGATVRNIGNIWTKVKVTQGDMGYGKDITGKWNVQYDLRMGNDNAYYVNGIMPNTTAVTPNFLCLSSLDELDFSIMVLKGDNSPHSGTMTIAAEAVPFGTAPGCVGIFQPCIDE
jgi:hypothetical protein